MLRGEEKPPTFTGNSLREFSVGNTCNTAAAVRHHSSHRLNLHTCASSPSPPLDLLCVVGGTGCSKPHSFGCVKEGLAALTA